MSNDYYNGVTDEITPFTNARAEEVAQQFNLIAAAFDAIPAARDLVEGRQTYGVAGGAANALTVTLDSAITGYQAGLTVRLKLVATNTGPMTLNINGIGAVPLILFSGSPLTGGELPAGAVVQMTFDGASFRASAPTISLTSDQVTAIVNSLGTAYAALTGADFSGVVAATTPNAGTTGGFRLRANPTSGLAIFQVLTPDGAGQYGYWAHTSAGLARWTGGTLASDANITASGTITSSGAMTAGGKITAGAGLQVNGGTIYEGPNAVWHAGNFTPSGKQDALGYTPANRAGDTFTGAITVQGLADVRTPTAGTTGGLRLRSRAANDVAYFQITNADVSAQ